MQMGKWQRLKRGDVIRHQRFEVPRGLHEWAGPKHTVDEFVATWFSMVRAFCASALSGVQLSVRKGHEVARFGIPISHVRGFFADREREGGRRKALLHFVGEYSYQRGEKQVTVGEHLRGTRRFTWRDYDIMLSAPGIHHPSPEGFAAEALSDEDILPLPPAKDIAPISRLASMMQRTIESLHRVPFRRGQPTSTYRTHNLDSPTRHVPDVE
jgi:hypothetical protein